MPELPKNIKKQLKSHKTSLGENPCFPPENEYAFDYRILSKYFDKVCDDLEKSEEGGSDENELKNRLNQLVNQCQRLEEPIKEQLETLCFNLINTMFEIPDDVEFECSLEQRIDSGGKRIVPDNTDDIEFDGIDEIDKLNLMVYKRRMVNAIIQGASMFYAHDIEWYIGEIYRLNPKLIELYREILALNSYLLFYIDDFVLMKSPELAGNVDVYLGDEDVSPKIVSKGIIFPILLSESLKGFMELFASHGLPNDRKSATYVIKKSDFLLAEPWDMRLGYPIWEIIEKNISDKNKKVIPLFFMELFSLDTEEFNRKMKEILANTNKGKDAINDIFKSIFYNLKKDDFSVYIASRNKKNSVINDEYFTSDELIENN